MRKVILILGFCWLTWLATPIFGQEKGSAQKPNDILVEKRVMVGTGEAGALSFGVASEGPGSFQFISSEMSFDGKVVKGQPYSAEAVTESTQTLSDGNRINHKTSALLYRDGEGRTRREQTLTGIGAWTADSEPLQFIVISDPVAGVQYHLDPREHVARKMPTPKIEISNKSTGAAEGKPIRRQEIRIVSGSGEAGMGPGPNVFYQNFSTEDAKIDSLGKQTIEGVVAEGTRSTLTIAAGKIGNEQPIQVVTERWFSPELQVVVMSKHSDPRMGETTYRLTAINRAEPSRSLFEVPADYTVKEGKVMFQRKIETKGDK